MPLLLISLFFIIFNYFALRKNLLPGIHIDRQNYGTVYYALSFFILILIFWEGYKIIIIAGMMVMAVGDAAAAIVGRTVSHPHSYVLIKDNKSQEGSLTMLFVSTAVIYLTFVIYSTELTPVNYHPVILFLFSLVTAVVATAAESLGDKGNDNLSVPIISAVILYFLLKSAQILYLQFLLGMLLAVLVSFISYRIEFLTKSGAVATFILATIIFGFGGWTWCVPILTFFLLSSLLSKIFKAEKNSIFEKGSQRDHVQVLANGGIAALLMILQVLYPQPEIYIFYLAAISAAMSDTWATEIGMILGKNPRLISNFNKVAPGTSGGITIAGLFGSLIGSIIIALSGIFLMRSVHELNFYKFLLIITLSGFGGGLLDSVLGATLQAKYKCTVCHKITEKRIHCSSHVTQRISGLQWMNNDTVNFINTLSGILICAGLLNALW